MTDNKVSESAAQATDFRVKVEWICNLGEQPNHVAVHLNRYTRKYDLVVTGDSTFFIVDEHGQIRYQKRLEFTPSCLQTFHLP